MGDMHYCRFRNALGDVTRLNRYLNDEGGNLDQLSPEERDAAEKAIRLCRKIGEDWMVG